MTWITGALKLIPLAMTAIGAVERFVKGKGKDKQDAAVAMVRDLLPMVEAGIGQDLLDDEKVQSALRKLIDAGVELQNVVADAKARRQ